MKEDMLNYPEWQIPLQEAVSEPDLAKLPARIERAETSIFERLQRLRLSNDSVGESEAIHDALNILRTLKRERLEFPDWN